MTPGATEKDLNFCWYSITKGLAKVKLGKKEDLSDAKVYDGTVTDINRSNSVETYKASNKVSIKGALEKTLLITTAIPTTERHGVRQKSIRQKIFLLTKSGW